MTEDLRERLEKARELLAGHEECRATILSRYDNRLVKCRNKGPHDGHEGVDYRPHEGLDYGELRHWQR